MYVSYPRYRRTIKICTQRLTISSPKHDVPSNNISASPSVSMHRFYTRNDGVHIKSSHTCDSMGNSLNHFLHYNSNSWRKISLNVPASHITAQYSMISSCNSNGWVDCKCNWTLMYGITAIKVNSHATSARYVQTHHLLPQNPFFTSDENANTDVTCVQALRNTSKNAKPQKQPAY